MHACVFDIDPGGRNSGEILSERARLEALDFAGARKKALSRPERNCYKFKCPPAQVTRKNLSANTTRPFRILKSPPNKLISQQGVFDVSNYHLASFVHGIIVGGRARARLHLPVQHFVRANQVDDQPDSHLSFDFAQLAAFEYQGGQRRNGRGAQSIASLV
jgi:hypothetical protein